MNEHTEHQIIRSQDGTPLFALIPWDEYVNQFEGRPDEEVLIPHEVVVMHVEHEMPLIRAWREYKGMTQAEVAQKMQITQPAYAKLESSKAAHRTSTLKRIADALDVEWEQLQE